MNKAKLTIEQLIDIYALHEVQIGKASAADMTKQCNEQDGINGRNPEQWANFFASQEAFELRAEAAEYEDFHNRAYGE